MDQEDNDAQQGDDFDAGAAMGGDGGGFSPEYPDDADDGQEGGDGGREVEHPVSELGCKDRRG